MSLNRISFLEGWERNPAAAFLRGRGEDVSPSDTESDTYQELPEDSSLASSFPSTYSRLNFNPYAGPGWNESAVDDRDDRPSLLGSLGLSPTTTREGRADLERGPRSPASAAAEAVPGSVPHKEHRPPQLPAWLPETRGAFEVSPARRIAQVCLAVIYCFLSAGIVFGFAALKPVLIREKVYRNLCSPQELEKNVGVCYGQQIRLNLMFTIAAVVTNVSALPVGAILDTYGPRVSSIIGCVCLAIGTIVFACASQLPFDGYIPGYLLLSLGGPFVFIPSFQLSNTFPTRSGLILSMLTGAFDASSALFLVFRLWNEHTAGDVSIQKFFLAYLIVPVLIIILQLTVMPATSYKTAGELVQQAEIQVVEEINDRVDDQIPDRNEGERQRNDRRVHRHSIVTQIQDLLDDGTASITSTVGFNDSVFHTDPNSPASNDHLPQSASTSKPQPVPPNTPSTHTSGVWGVMHGYSAFAQLRSPWFILITAFTVLMMLRINYFVATLRQQYTFLLHSAPAAARINGLFDILLPVGGLVSVPFTGLFLDTLRTRTVLGILALIATLIGVLGCIPDSTGAAYANVVLFALYRPFYYTAVSDYAAKVFGFQTFGKVYGLVICLAGMGSFAQTGLDALTLRSFSGDPVPVNIGLTLSTGIAGAALVAYDTVETGLSRENALLHGVAARDWERQPLLEATGENQVHRAYRT
ncbi:hypothetical protein N7462_000108 [Penicillium macrosclerotiorum]|uniref:uncharacterized protein n=1 Tax=Penicillium macrosclerotiorum TaxID=303699 RepID=UPI00254889EA|nr:uncharacterized protein N7462_000108 [Penicillium macrosclerotiorum]KAJ5698103.1 hypothetical protein N7462_000108 [Penicillium macrosclerotiorum]